MIQEDYVNFKQAKKLKELEFPQDIEMKYCYGEDGELYLSSYNYFSRPTLSLVARWLREEKGLSVLPYKLEYAGHWQGTAYGCKIAFKELFDLKRSFLGMMAEYDTYEDALSAGIDKALDLIQ